MNKLKQNTEFLHEPIIEPMTKTEMIFARLIWGFIFFGVAGFWLGIMVILMVGK